MSQLGLNFLLGDLYCENDEPVLMTSIRLFVEPDAPP